MSPELIILTNTNPELIFLLNYNMNNLFTLVKTNIYSLGIILIQMI
mgnify:FL=1|jgi:hypothetical protein